jgi:hypothetical protein
MSTKKINNNWLIALYSRGRTFCWHILKIFLRPIKILSLFIIATSIGRIYRIVSLHPPGQPVTAAVLRTAIKETHCIQARSQSINKTELLLAVRLHIQGGAKNVIPFYHPIKIVTS